MKPPTNGLEIVIKMKPSGDFTVESNSRENYRVLKALVAVCRSMRNELNALNGNLVLPSSHTGRFERSVN